MVSVNDAPLQTAFTVSVDYRFGLTTGISAEERTNTIRALANGNIGPEDFVRPGHVFPLVARDGGVLIRSGHTEAAVDLCRLAGLETVGVLAELVNDDGSVKRLPDLLAFGREHRLLVVSIADLIEYRQRRDQLVRRVATFETATPIGSATAIVYATPFEPLQHVALGIRRSRQRRARSGAHPSRAAAGRPSWMRHREHCPRAGADRRARSAACSCCCAMR